MIWVGWRQQRTETMIAAGIIALLAALLIPTGLNMGSAYDHAGLSACAGGSTSDACGSAIQAFVSRFARIGDFISWLTMVPGIIGILLAAPIISQLEHGTYRLDWTQSITRGRWIAGKLGLAVASGIVAAVVFTLLVTWWRAPLVHLQGRMNNSVYDSEGIVAIGYTLFALGLAAAVGAVWRRGVPALVVGFAGYFATRLFVDTWLRQRLVHSVSLTWPTQGKQPPADLRNAWVLTEFPSDKAGHMAIPPPPPGLNCNPCRAEQVSDYMHTVYHPASQFWSLQLIETAIFGGAALVLLTFAAWWTHERVS